MNLSSKVYFLIRLNQDQDCVVTSWSPWSVSCSTTCGQGHRVRFRSVTTLSHGSGRPCPDKLERYKRCRLPSCPVDHCDLVTWSEWGACSATCGSSGIQVISKCPSLWLVSYSYHPSPLSFNTYDSLIETWKLPLWSYQVLLKPYICYVFIFTIHFQTRERKSSDCQDKAREERVCLLPCCRTVNGKCVDKPPL